MVVGPAPEEGLVTITPEELLPATVLVLKLDGPSRIGLLGQKLNVLQVVGLVAVDVEAGDGQDGNASQRDVAPDFRGALAVSNGVLISLLEGLSTLSVGLVDETVVETLKHKVSSGGSTIHCEYGYRKDWDWLVILKRIGMG